MDNLWSSAFWLIFYGSGLIASLLVYGLLQERIMTQEYAGQMFTFSVFCVFCNRAFAVLFALVMAWRSGESLALQVSIWKYLIVSLSNVYASTCQYEALKYVSFVVQMLAKSFKMMPVMLWGIAISGKRYGLKDWLVATAVTLGVTWFLLAEPGTADGESTATNPYGLLLLGCFLALDGLTSTMQEKLFNQEHVSKYNQMLYVNLCSMFVSMITLIFAGQLFPALAFCMAHQAFVLDLLVLSASAVSGQFFIYSQIKEFGALVFAATMNVRQVCSIILSYIMYGHSIVFWQVVGLLIVFSALFYKSLSSFQQEAPPEKLPLTANSENAPKVLTA